MKKLILGLCIASMMVIGTHGKTHDVINDPKTGMPQDIASSFFFIQNPTSSMGTEDMSDSNHSEEHPQKSGSCLCGDFLCNLKNSINSILSPWDNK